MSVDGEIEPASPEYIARAWAEHWGGEPLISGRRQYVLADVEGLAWRSGEGELAGLVTWCVEGEDAEIVSIHAETPGSHVGGRLLDAAEEELRRRGVHTAFVTTTNDNLRALAFYVRRGYRLVRLHLGAMDRVRRAKPGVSAVGADGIPLRDMWELEKPL